MNTRVGLRHFANDCGLFTGLMNCDIFLPTLGRLRLGRLLTS